MHSIWKDMLTAFFMGAVVPGLLLNVTARASEDRPPEETVVETVPPAICPMRLRMDDGTVRVMNMDDYLLGVVLGEMPASFETEALKAQSVVARTYTQKAYETGGKHGDGSVCGHSACCQAYVSQEEYLQRGGDPADVDKIRWAIQATSGQVLTYEGSLIESTYFSCSGGTTEDAAAVWGTDFPYLQAVPSPGEEQAAYFTDTVSFSPEGFRAALNEALPGTPDTWFGEVTYTDGGGVDTMMICGKSYTGPQLRRLLHLRSTAFTLLAEKDGLTITTRGFGHRVGMSQYGADAMAAGGSTYEEILAHYYQGTTLHHLP